MHKRVFVTSLFLGLFIASSAFSQVEFTTWGTLTGVRNGDDFTPFNSTILLSDAQNKHTQWVWKERQKTNFQHINGSKVFSYDFGQLTVEQKTRSVKEGMVALQLELNTPVDTLIGKAYYRLLLDEEFGDSLWFSVEGVEQFNLDEIASTDSYTHFKAPVRSFAVHSFQQEMTISFREPTVVVVKPVKRDESMLAVDVALPSGQLLKDSSYVKTLEITTNTKAATPAAHITLFPEQKGNPFDGIGGNFRLQNPKADPQVIDYLLENLPVRWGRVELPWRQWHSDLANNPLEAAKKGELHPKVKAAMEMAQRLNKKGIPVMLAVWFAPDWAIIGERAEGVNLDGTRGNALDQQKKEHIYESLTSYIQFLKENYGVEAVMFSFNESDLGIDVRQSAVEHQQLIKELGAYFRSKGIQTDFLLGDTADAEGWNFTTNASTDPEVRPYVGAVSFHSWRGYTSENLLRWYDIANRVNAPLFVGEGSIDAGAWRYPLIFEEASYALEEMAVYLKIVREAQPLSILQWQLTSDYSVLSGGGVFGNVQEELHPTQRFYNLQQLGATKQGMKAIALKGADSGMEIAALISEDGQDLALHIVNKRATREVIIQGIPDGIRHLTMHVTNANEHFNQGKTYKVRKGQVKITVKGGSYVSLFTKGAL